MELNNSEPFCKTLEQGISSHLSSSLEKGVISGPVDLHFVVHSEVTDVASWAERSLMAFSTLKSSRRVGRIGRCAAQKVSQSRSPEVAR